MATMTRKRGGRNDAAVGFFIPAATHCHMCTQCCGPEALAPQHWDPDQAEPWDHEGKGGEKVGEINQGAWEASRAHLGLRSMLSQLKV